MYFKRNLEKELQNRLTNNKSFLLFGPRQTGKSTLIEGLFAKIPAHQKLEYYFQFPTQRERIEDKPEIIKDEVEFKQKTKQPLFVFIDEIQKIPGVLDVLQYLIDKKKIVLAASGSSARQMRKLKANWLPGRVHYFELKPLTFSEIISAGSKVKLEELLLYGGLPAIMAQESFKERLRDLEAYSHLYLEEEIRAEAVTRNLPRFTKFLRLAALESGTAPNFSKIAQTIGVSHTTIAEYYQILNDTLITQTLTTFGKSRDQVLKKERFYFFDRGVRNAAALLPIDTGLLKLQMGTLFEHLIIQEAFAHFGSDCQLSYYRNKKGQEVDLIIESRKKTIAVEIKATQKPIQKDFLGLEFFRSKYKVDACVLVCQTPCSQKENNYWIVSWRDFSIKISELLN